MDSFSIRQIFRLFSFLFLNRFFALYKKNNTFVVSKLTRHMKKQFLTGAESFEKIITNITPSGQFPPSGENET